MSGAPHLGDPSDPLDASVPGVSFLTLEWLTMTFVARSIERAGARGVAR